MKGSWIGCQTAVSNHSSVAKWKADCSDFNWMLVIDNINDPEHLSSMIPQSRRQRGSVLCTTQSSQLFLDEEAKCVTLLPFDPEHGASFLIQRLKPALDIHSDMQLTAAKATSKLLGGVPLFLAAAADFLSDSGWSFNDFVEQYREISYSRSGAHKSISLDSPLWYRHLDRHSNNFDYALQQLSVKGYEAIRICALFDGIEIAESLIFSQHKDDIIDFLRPRSVSKYVHL